MSTKCTGIAGGGGAGRRAGNFSRERIFALAAVDEFDRLAEALAGDMAEAFEWAFAPAASPESCSSSARPNSAEAWNGSIAITR